jgi:hypothetical protein
LNSFNYGQVSKIGDADSKTVNLYGSDSLAFGCVSQNRIAFGLSSVVLAHSLQLHPSLALLSVLGFGLFQTDVDAFQLVAEGCSCGTNSPCGLIAFQLLGCVAFSCGSPSRCVLATVPLVSVSPRVINYPSFAFRE